MFNKLALPLLVVLISSVYLYTASQRALLDDGDALYATVARQMVERGDWVTPYANGVRFLDKPPMMYWLMGLAFSLIGTSEFAARLPSVLAVLGTVLLLYGAGKKYAHPSCGFAAGLAVALCVGTFLFTRMVFPDMLFVFLLTLSLCAFLEWYLDALHPVLPALLFYATLAAAVLTKGMIGIVFPVAIILLFLTWSREWRRLRHFHPAKGILLFLALAVPWHILAAQRNAGFLWYFFMNEQVLRFLGRRQPFDYESISVPVFWLLILLWFFPWSVFLPAAVPVLRQLRTGISGEGALARLSCSWIIVVLGFFTFSSRIEHYSLPLLPPLAFLAGLALTAETLQTARLQICRERWLKRGFTMLGLLGAAAGLAVLGWLAWWMIGDVRIASSPGATAHYIRAYSYYFAPIFDLSPQMAKQLSTPLLGTGLALSLGMPAAWWLNRHGKRVPAVLALSFMMAAFSLFAFQSLGVFEDELSSRQFGRILNTLYQPGDSLVAVGDFESANSINFYAPMPLQVYGGTAAVLTWGLRYPDAPHVRLQSAADFESRWNGAQRTFLLVADRQIDELHAGHLYPVLHSAGRTLFCNQPVRGTGRAPEG